jgi:hypothetical protein
MEKSKIELQQLDQILKKTIADLSLEEFSSNLDQRLYNPLEFV